LNIAFCPMRSASGSTTCLSLGGWHIAPVLVSAFMPLLTSAQC
jgi:hypothetical protein